MTGGRRRLVGKNGKPLCRASRCPPPLPPPGDSQPAGPADAGELLEWVRAYYACDGIAFHAAAVAPALEELLHDATLGRAFFVSRGDESAGNSDGAIAGYTIFTFGFDAEFGGRLATVTDLFFRPEHRRRGAGVATLEFIVAVCREAGVRALELQVEEHNLPAQALYGKFGFRRLSRLPLHLALD